MKAKLGSVQDALNGVYGTPHILAQLADDTQKLLSIQNFLSFDEEPVETKRGNVALSIPLTRGDKDQCGLPLIGVTGLFPMIEHTYAMIHGKEYRGIAERKQGLDTYAEWLVKMHWFARKIDRVILLPPEFERFCNSIRITSKNINGFYGMKNYGRPTALQTRQLSELISILQSSKDDLLERTIFHHLMNITLGFKALLEPPMYKPQDDPLQAFAIKVQTPYTVVTDPILRRDILIAIARGY